jgi:hypothetical protein
MSSDTPLVNQEDSDLLAAVETELDRWRNILFTFTMDSQQSNDHQYNTAQDPSSSASTSQSQSRPPDDTVPLLPAFLRDHALGQHRHTNNGQGYLDPNTPLARPVHGHYPEVSAPDSVLEADAAEE